MGRLQLLARGGSKAVKNGEHAPLFNENAIGQDMESLSGVVFPAHFLEEATVWVWTGSQLAVIRKTGVLVKRGWEQIEIRDVMPLSLLPGRHRIRI